ncbi:MAG TPA: hypothetical protein VK912_13960 [Longimicrobiales bacterium]|nr:hypothetical protein [Longimicrobiales bacterium]
MKIHARMFIGITLIAQVTAGCDSPAGPDLEHAAPGPMQVGESAAHAASLAAPAPGSERSVSEALYDLTDVHFVFSCSEDGDVLDPGEGELVRMEGSIYERMTLLRDASGGHHMTAHSMPVGLRGEGVISGEEFRVAEREHSTANVTARRFTGTYRQELKLVGQDTRRTFWIVWSGHYTVTADDRIIVQRDSEHVQCRM